MRTPYEEDIPLLSKLGLQQFDIDNDDKYHHIGTVVNENYEVDVWVLSCPTLFWRFQIKSNQEDQIVTTSLQTGSGTLTEYWPTVEHFGMGMLEVISEEKIKVLEV